MRLSFKKILNFKIAFIGIFIVFLLFAFNFFKEYNRNRQLNEEIKKLEASAKELEAKNLAILNLAKYLDTEEFLESEARTKLGLQKPGERAIMVNIPGFAETSSTVKDAGGLLTNPVKWWKYFFEG